LMVKDQVIMFAQNVIANYGILKKSNPQT